MNAIYVIASISVHPGREEDFLPHAEPSIAQSRSEKGCIAYDMHLSATEPGRIVSIEQWENEEAVKRHNSSTHLQALVATVGPLLAAPPQIGNIIPRAVEPLPL